MAQPTPHEMGTPPPRMQAPIAEAHIFIYGLERGRTEVSVKFPDDAKPGAAGAAAKQATLHQLLVSELEDAFRIFEESAARG